MSDIIFRTLEDDDIPRVNNFYNNYHQGGRTMDQFRWEFQEGPHGKAVYCLAIVAETGQIIGIQAGLPLFCINTTNEKVLTIKSEDTLIDTDLCATLRKKNLFKELYVYFIARCRDQGAECIWGFTWVKNSLKRIGFQIPFDTGQGLLVIHPVKSFRNLSKLNIRNTLVDKIKIGALVTISWVFGWKRRFYSSMNELTLIDGIYSNVNFFTGLSQNDHDLVYISQDQAYLDWRLKKNPYPLKYSVLNFLYRYLPVGQVITSFHPNGQGYIEQFLFVPGLPAKTQKLILKMAVQYLSQAGAIHVRVLTFNGNPVNRSEMNLLKSFGFFLIKKGMGFIFLSLNHRLGIRPDQFLLSRLYSQGHN